MTSRSYDSPFNTGALGDNPYASNQAATTGIGSLVQAKQAKLLDTSVAKKALLDPSTAIPADSVSITDADTVKDRSTGQAYRLDQSLDGTSLDAYETHKDFAHDSTRNDNKMLKQRQAIADDANLPLSYIPDEAVYRRGQAAKDVLQQAIAKAQNVSLVPSGEIDQDKRAIADLVTRNVDGTTTSLLPQVNTPESNADYRSIYDLAQRGEDVLRERARRADATKYSVSDETRETIPGGILNLGAAAATSAFDLIANAVKSPLELSEQVREEGITNKQRELYKTVIAKQGTGEQLTPEEQSIMNAPQESALVGMAKNFARPFINNILEGDSLLNITGKDIFKSVLGNTPLPMSVKQNLDVSKAVQENFTDKATEIQDNFRKIYNSAGSEQLHTDAKSLFNDSVVPTFVEGLNKTKKGNVGDVAEGTLQMADAIANASAGIFRVGANNKQAVAEEIIKQIPNAYAATKHGVVMFLGLYTDNAAKAQELFIKEHGRYPEGSEVDRLQIESGASAALDTIADKMMASKAGVARSFVREGSTEGVQAVLEGDAGKQDLSKIDWAEAYANGVVGALSGAGTTAAFSPKDIGSDVKDAASITKAVIPDRVSNLAQAVAQKVTGTIAEAKGAVQEVASEVASADTVATVDPVQQSAQTENHSEALKTLFKPESIAAATTTPESTEAFLTEATNRNLELNRELISLVSKDAPTQQDNARSKQLLAEIRANKEKIEGVRLAKAPVEDTIEADVEKAVTALPDRPDTEAVDRIIRSMRQPSKMTEEAMATLEQKAPLLLEKANLTPEQASVVNAFVEKRKALKTMGEVNTAVLYGKETYTGLVEHQEMVSDYISQGKLDVAGDQLVAFDRLTKNQEVKAKALNAISEAARIGDIPLQNQLIKDFAIKYPNRKPLNVDNIEKFDNFKSKVNQEATLLRAAFKESSLHYQLALKEGKQPKAEPTASVQPAAEAVSMPAPVADIQAEEATKTDITSSEAATEQVSAVEPVVQQPEAKVEPAIVEPKATPAPVQNVAVDPVRSAPSAPTHDNIASEYEDEAYDSDPWDSYDEGESYAEDWSVYSDASVTEAAPEVVKDPAVEELKAMALKKDYHGAPKLAAALRDVFKANSTSIFDTTKLEFIKNVLGSKLDNKTLATSLLDTQRVFKATGKNISAYFSAKPVRKNTSQSVLQTVPNFFSSLNRQEVMESLALTPNQARSLNGLAEFMDGFNKTFNTATFNGKKLHIKAVLEENPVLYFMKENGRVNPITRLTELFDENFISTLGVTSYAWIANNASSIIEHDNAGINQILGRDTKHPVSRTESSMLIHKGVLRSALVSSLGKEIYKSLGLSFNKKEDGAIEAKMVEALGIYAIMTLEHMDLLGKATAIHKDAFALMKKGEDVPEKLQSEPTKPQDSFYFVNVNFSAVKSKSGKFTKVSLPKEIKDIVMNASTKNSDRMLTRLFGTTSQRDLPSLVAPELANIPKFIKRGIKRIPERVRKALHKYANNAFKVNTSKHAVYSFLEPEQRLTMQDYVHDLDGVHSTRIKSVQGNNRSILNGTEAYDSLIDHLNNQPEGLASPLYMLSSVWNNGRAGMEGLINPQGNKLHREMLDMAAWESTVDSPRKLTLFKKAIAEAFDAKIDKQTDEASEANFDTIFATPIVEAGVEAIRKVLAGTEMTATEKLENQQAILAAVKFGGHKVRTLSALTALVEYSPAEAFKTSMTMEVDGVTNGIIIGLIQLMGARPRQMKGLLESGALFQDPSKVYGEFISKVGSVDNYQRMAHTMVEYRKNFYGQVSGLFAGELSMKNASYDVKKFVEAGGTIDVIDSVNYFVGELEKAGSITSEARKLAKNPLMITSYGAALTNVIAGVSTKVLNNLYNKVEDNKDNAEVLAEIATQVSAITNTKIVITPANALTFVLNATDTARFKDMVALSIGANMGDAIKQHFQEFIDKRTEINNAMTLVHKAFILKYDAAYTAAREAKGSNLSKEEIDALVKKLEPSMASFEHAMSDGNIDTELLISNSKSEHQFGKADYKAQVNTNAQLKTGFTSITTYGSIQIFGMPGVKSAIKAIHSSDGAVQYKIMETEAVLNVHDADISGIDGANRMALKQNQAFKEVMESYSVRAAVQKSLLRAMDALTVEEKLALDDIIKLKDDTHEDFLGHGFVNTQYVYGNKIVGAKYASVDAFVNEFKDTTKRDMAAKKALVNGIKSWGQYNLNHAAYVPNEEFADIIEALEALEEEGVDEESYINKMVAEEIKSRKAAMSSEEYLTFKSSAEEDIDTETFVPDMAMAVSPDTVMTIFDQLGIEDSVKDTVEHAETLRRLLDISLRPTLAPIEILVRKLGQTNSGVLEKSKIFINIGASNRIYTTDQSAQEVYAHEVVHHTTVAALTTDYWARKQARKLFDLVREQVSPDSFLDYDAQGNVIIPAGSTLTETKAKAKMLHDHIFDNDDVTEVRYKNPITNEVHVSPLNNGLFEFIAMGVTNPKFIEILKGIDLNKIKVPTTAADKVFGLFTTALTNFLQLFRSSKHPEANTAVLALVHKLARTNQAQASWLTRKIEENAHLEELLNSKLFQVLRYSAVKSGALLQKTGISALASVGTIIGLGPVTSIAAYRKVAVKLVRRMKLTEKALAYQTFNEIEGISKTKAKYHHLLAKSNKFIDQLRREIAASLSQYLLRGFVAGKPSREENVAITKTMLKTDMAYLLDTGYSWERVFEMLKDDAKLDKEMADVESLLQAEAPTNFGYYRTQAASLGHMMVHGIPSKWGTKRNANQVTHLGGTGLSIEGDVNAIEKLIDTLASLRALSYLGDEEEGFRNHVDNFLSVAEREFATDRDNNGVMLAYLAHKDVIARALEESFAGQKELMVKGYTKEIYNPRTTVLTAPASQTEELKAKGYKVVETALGKDPKDPSKNKVSMFINKTGETATFMKMIVSLTSKKAQGTDLTVGYSNAGELNPALLGEFDTDAVTAEGPDIIAHPDYADINKKHAGALLVPLENTRHEIVGYRYLMSEANKDLLLEKDNSFNKILGMMDASITDKRESARINKETVALIKEDFDANYAKDPEAFVSFGPKSSDKEYRELYALLPDDMRKEIKRIWKGNTMLVRAEVFRVIFGFRKFSVSEDDEMEEVHQSVLAKFGSSLRDKLRSPKSKMVELGLQELAKEVKDAIVIKSGSTLRNNVVSNNWLLWLNGLSRAEIIDDQAVGLDGARQYQKDLSALMDLERSVRINPRLQNSANVKAKIKQLKNDMAVNPIAFLMDSAVFQTIVEDVDPDEGQYTYKGLIQTKLAPAVARVPKPLRNLASLAYMAHGTKTYEFMREATQLSDLVARYALHKHNITKKGMTPEASVDMINEVFINYDLPTSKTLQYMNDMNLAMFTKFLLRSQKIIAQTAMKGPARMLGLFGIEDVFGDIPSLDDGNIITTSAIGRLSNPLGMIDEVTDLHTLHLLDPTILKGAYIPN